jgi:hypothetical protein
MKDQARNRRHPRRTWSRHFALAAALAALAAPAWSEETAAPAADTAAAPADTAAAEPEAPALETAITRVTLYSDQALVVRRGAVSVPAGRSRWRLPALPAALRDEAVRARLVSGEGARLANLEILLTNETVFRKDEAEEADRALKEIEGRHKAAADAIATLDGEAALLRGFQVGKRPEGRPERPEPAPIDVAAWAATLGFVEDSLAENRREARRLAAELDDIEEELAVAVARAEKLASGKVHSEKAVLLELEAEAACAVELEVTYLVPGPGWWPRYDVRADVEKGTVELVSYALVRQETGEDWQTVELAFSAAEPARAADIPQLVAWRIGEARTTQDPLTLFGGSEPFDVHSRGSLRLTNASTSSPATEVWYGAPAQQLALQNAAGANAILAQAQEKRGGAQSAERQLGLTKAGATRESLKRLAELQAANDLAAQQRDWGAFYQGNLACQEEILNLDGRFRKQFAEDLMACEQNILRGERLIKSARFADGVVPPVQSSRGYDYRYRSLRPESIPSDGAFNKVVIDVDELPAEFIYEAAPEARELAFLTTRIRNLRRQPYLDGPASVFLGPDFVGDGRVPTTARGEEFAVNLGADESVAVRRRIEEKRETTGFFTSYHKYRNEVEVTVKNHKGRAARVAVLDRVPFTDDARVTVKRLDVAPEAAREDRKGLLRWELDLAAGAERKVTFSYTVEIPADRRLVRAADETVTW